MEDISVRLIESLDALIAPFGVAAFTAGALLQFIPRSNVRNKLEFLVRISQLAAVLLWMYFWNRYLLPHSGIEANIGMNALGAAFIAISLWGLPEVYKRMQRRGISHDGMDT